MSKIAVFLGWHVFCYIFMSLIRQVFENDLEKESRKKSKKMNFLSTFYKNWHL